jgi:hypothetical protein
MALQWGRLLGFGARDITACTSREVNLFIDRAQANGLSSGKDRFGLVALKFRVLLIERISRLTDARKEQNLGKIQ